MMTVTASPVMAQAGGATGPDAAALEFRRQFHRFKSFLKSDEELLRTIEHGIVQPGCILAGQLTEAERQDALAYIRLLVQQGITDPGTPTSPRAP